MNPTNKEPRLIQWILPLVLIGLLAALVLFPLLNQVHEGTGPNICLSNLKQIGLAIGMYAGDDRLGRCPAGGNPPNLVDSFRLLSNRLTSAKVFCCPKDLRVRPAVSFDQLTAANISYSYVPNIKWQDPPDSALALDRIYKTKRGTAFPKEGNHKLNGGNVLFNDGHVEWRVTLPSDLKDKDGKLVVLSP